MSHWMKAKLELKCSLALLRKALIKIMPEWEKYIKTDPNGGIQIHNSYTHTNDTAHLSVPHGESGIRYGDLGFKKNEDGTWEVIKDSSGLPYDVRNIEQKLAREVKAMRMAAKAAAMGGQLRSETTENGITRMRILIPSKQRAALA